MSKRKRKKKWDTYKVLGTLIMVLGIFLVLFGFKDSIKSWVLRGSVEDEVSTQLQQAVEGMENATEDTFNKTTIWRYPDKSHEPISNREENTKEYASKGALLIPKIEETLAVMEGVGGNNMYRGAGEQYLDQKMGIGNYVLSSHRMYDGTLFADLEDVEVGDEVYITDYETVWKYEVTGSNNNVETTQTQLLQDTEESVLTLYGCTSDGTMRVVKRAKLIGYTPITELGEEDAKLLNIN